MRRGAATAALLVAGCGGVRTTTSSPSTPPPPSAPVVSPDPPPLPELVVPEGFEVADRDFGPAREIELDDAGTEPRREARYTPVAGAIGRFRRVFDRSPPAPRFVVDTEVEVRSVDDAWIAYRSTIRAFTFERRADDTYDETAAAAAAEAIVGSVIVGYVSRTGHDRSRRVLRRTAVASFFDKLHLGGHTWIALPSQPFGVGAQWTMLNRQPSFEEHLEFRVVEHTRDRVVIEESGVLTGATNGESRFRFELDLRAVTHASRRDTEYRRAARDDGPAARATEHSEVTPIGR